MGDDEQLASPDDLDYISEEGTGTTWDEALPIGRGWGRSTPVFVPKTSTPLEEATPDAVIPTFALWSMKYLRHVHLFGGGGAEIREAFGDGDHAIYVLDDGRNYCLVSRKVGTSPDGCTFCLVAQIPIAIYEELLDGASPDAAFSDARTFSLCSVFEALDGVSNVAVSERYATVGEVPSQYLPPNPPILFTEPPEG